MPLGYATWSLVAVSTEPSLTCLFKPYVTRRHRRPTSPAGKISPADSRAGLLAASCAVRIFPASPVLRCAPAAARGDGGAVAVSEPGHRRDGPGEQSKETLMAITLGTFTQLDDGVLTRTFETLNVTA